jgi:hypothetical protein
MPYSLACVSLFKTVVSNGFSWKICLYCQVVNTSMSSAILTADVYLIYPYALLLLLIILV